MRCCVKNQSRPPNRQVQAEWFGRSTSTPDKVQLGQRGNKAHHDHKAGEDGRAEGKSHVRNLDKAYASHRFTKDGGNYCVI